MSLLFFINISLGSLKIQSPSLLCMRYKIDSTASTVYTKPFKKNPVARSDPRSKKIQGMPSDFFCSLFPQYSKSYHVYCGAGLQLGH